MNTQGPRSTFDRVSKSRNSMTISIFIIQTRTTRAYFFLFYLFFSVSMLNVMSDHLFNATIMSFFSTSKKITILESAMQFIQLFKVTTIRSYVIFYRYLRLLKNEKKLKEKTKQKKERRYGSLLHAILQRVTNLILRRTSIGSII